MNASMKSQTSLSFLLLLLHLIANCMAVELMLNANTSQPQTPLFAFVKKDMRYLIGFFLSLSYTILYNIYLYQGDGTLCYKGFGPGDYPSYDTFTSTVTPPTVPWLRPLITTPSMATDGQYQCRRESDCHENASCEYDKPSRKYKCKCKKWYEGDGWSSCEPGRQQ